MKHSVGARENVTGGSPIQRLQRQTALPSASRRRGTASGASGDLRSRGSEGGASDVHPGDGARRMEGYERAPGCGDSPRVRAARFGDLRGAEIARGTSSA